jgi:geranylgeranyl pyrophosphate synthase
MSTTVSLKSLYKDIDPQLERVRKTVSDQWTEAFQLVYGPGSTPPRLGGKLLRPALCLLSAGACGAEDLDHYVEMAAGMELLHLAALAHDDVIDSADLRRGEISLNRLWDNHTAVLGGDYLVAKALSILTVYDSCDVIVSALESIHQMAEGELIYFGRGKENLNAEDCIRLSEKKTASLFAVTCSTPTLLHDEKFKQPLFDFGMCMGTAFQLVDDVIDLIEDEETLGKPSCGDIAEGKTTLPIIYMKEVMNAQDRAHLDSLPGKPVTPDNQAWVRDQMESTGSQDRVSALCREYIDTSTEALSQLPPGHYVDIMRDIAEFVLIRHS